MDNIDESIVTKAPSGPSDTVEAEKETAPVSDAPEQTQEQPDAPAEDAEEAERFKTENGSLRAKLIDSKARLTALSLGIDQARVDYVIRLAALDQIDVCALDADKKIKDAIGEVLTQIPEWGKTNSSPEPMGSKGAFRRMPIAGSDEYQSARTQFESGLRR